MTQSSDNNSQPLHQRANRPARPVWSLAGVPPRGDHKPAGLHSNAILLECVSTPAHVPGTATNHASHGAAQCMPTSRDGIAAVLCASSNPPCAGTWSHSAHVCW
jgi:hypothetical protein